MIGYVTLGTNRLPEAAAFYDALLSELGAGRFMESDTFVAWSASPDKPGIGITKPHNGEPASAGNGVMVALAVKDAAQVKAVYQKAIELGGQDEGEPGPRGDSGFYAAYFRDLDGNKLNVFCMNG